MIAPRGSVFKVAAAQLKAAESTPGYIADYHFSFESARALLSELTPARIDLLEALRQCGPCSVYALAKNTGRNYSNVHTDVNKREEHGLVKRPPATPFLCRSNRWKSIWLWYGARPERHCPLLFIRGRPLIRGSIAPSSRSG